MREYPIIFSRDMIEAIMAGRKTQTRHILKEPPPDTHDFAIHALAPDRKRALYYQKGNEYFRLNRSGRYWLPGDVLWVKETVKLMEVRMSRLSPPGSGIPVIVYRADRPESYWNSIEYQMQEDSYIDWTPSALMSKPIARIWLSVSDVRIERLFSISDEDILAEGWPGTPNNRCEMTLRERALARRWFYKVYALPNKILDTENPLAEVTEFSLKEIKKWQPKT